MTQRIRLHIDKLVVPPHLAGDRAAIEAAIRAELARQLGASPALPAQARRIDAVDGGTLAGGASLGTSIGAVAAREILK